MVCKEENGKMHQKCDAKRRKVLNNLKPGWEAPDGGWGWVLVVAAGLTNVFAVALNASFGLIFRERFLQFGISSTQTTTILNLNSAVASFVGLVNGPLYRKYTFRQAGCVSGVVCFAAICSLAFMKSFYGVMVFHSFMYASAKCILMSGSQLALISYFTKKRRVAVGLSWAVSGLGTISHPQLVTFLMSTYGAFGTIILLGAISLNSVVCFALMQPVQMRAKRSTDYKNIEMVTKENDEKSSDAVINGSKMENVRSRDNCYEKVEKRSSQHFHKNDETNELETPLMSPTENDRIVGLNSLRNIMETDCNQPASIILQRQLSLNELNSEKCIQKSNRKSCDVDGWELKIMDTDENSQVEIKNTSKNTNSIESKKNHRYEIVHENGEKLECLLGKGSKVTCQEVLEQKRTKMSWLKGAFRAVVTFFDLDLLRDCAFINIMIGVSLVLIIEINFLHLTPYILADYGLTDSQTAMIMSISGGVDVMTRLIVSVIANRIGWDNRTFLFIGVGITIVGRTALAHVNTYNMILGAVIFYCIGKATSFVFAALVLPDHVSLEKLPAATGLQLVARGILYLAIGPVIGWIRDTSGSYAMPLYYLNIFSLYIIISGIIGKLCCTSKHQRSE